MSYSSTILAESNLINYWHLDETSGTSAADSKGSLTGTYVGSPTLAQAGIDGSNAVSFSGSLSVYMKTAAAPPTGFPSGAAARTLECWIKTSASQTSGDGYLGILAYGALVNGQYCTIYATTDNTTLMFIVSSTHSCSGTVPGGYNDGKWHHLAATYDGTNMVLYFDGISIASSVQSISTVLGSNPFYVGVGVQDGDGGFNGLIDEVAVYSAALPADSVYSHYLAGGGIDYTQRGPYQRPAQPALRRGWSKGLFTAIVPYADPNWNLSIGIRDFAQADRRSFQTAAMTAAKGPWGSDLVVTPATSNGIKLGVPLAGATEFTLAALCTPDGTFTASSYIWGGEGSISANMRITLSAVNPWLAFQIGADGAFTVLTAPRLVGNRPVLITCRLTNAGVRSIWYGAYKVAERTDAGAAFGSGAMTNGMGLGGSPQSGNSGWSGRISAAYGWSRSLSDSEILALAADPLIPVRPLRTVQPAVLPPILYRLPRLRGSRMNDGFRELVGGFVNG